MNDAQHRLRFLGDKPQEERKGAEGTQRRRGVTQRRKGDAETQRGRGKNTNRRYFILNLLLTF